MCLEKLLINFAEKAERLKFNLTKFEAVQAEIAQIIADECKENESSKLASTATKQCMSVLLNADEIVDRLNMILEFQLPSSCFDENKLTKEPLLAISNETANAQPTTTTHVHKAQLTKYVPKSKFFIATITYVLDEEELLFYVWDKNNPQMSDIFKLRKAHSTLQLCVDPPFGAEVFGFLTDGYVFRAMFDADTKEVELIDVGENIDINTLEKNSKFYKLPENLQVIPRQAILCKLIGVMDKNYTNKEMQEFLKESLYGNHGLVINSTENEILQVLLVESVKEQPNQTISHEEPKFVEKETLSEKKESSDECELEELDDMPFGTTNALKAVLGYIPKDESRLCQFYDPKTGSCFKGSRCKLEHKPKSKHAFTTDVVPSHAYNYEHAEIVYEDQQIINITVTHVPKLTAFYAKINKDPNNIRELLVWEDWRIKRQMRFKSSGKHPRMFDMVLARPGHGLWYRAEVRNELIPGQKFEVFYVDYGNTGVVTLVDLALCPAYVLLESHQVQLIHIANVHPCLISRAQLLQGLKMLDNVLLNKTFDVRVAMCCHELDLFIDFVDDDKQAVVAKLCDEGLLKPAD